MEHLACCSALEAEIDHFADALAEADVARSIPSCPGWTAGDLATHVGAVHRWTEQLVARHAQHRINANEMEHDPGPTSPSWIRNGGSRLLATLRSTDPDQPMWAWGADQHVRFWSRRQLHETVIHRVDLELAMGEVPVIDPVVCADGIDEFLVNLTDAAAFSPGVGQLIGHGGRLAFTSRDQTRRWRVSLDQDTISISRDGAADVEVIADETELLLVLYRRRPLHHADVVVNGDEDLLRFWVNHSALL